MSRPISSYRGERRKRARRLGLIWRFLPRYREKTGQIVIAVERTRNRKIRRRLEDLPKRVVSRRVYNSMMSKQVRQKKYVKSPLAGSTANVAQMNRVFDRCVDRLESSRD